jgi:HPt (histidine-containing phosphotransfer) domain-containing protein
VRGSEVPAETGMGFHGEVGWTLPDALRELVLGGEREIVAEVLALFQSDTQSRLGMLREAVQSGDRPRVRSQAHSLKGSAVQVGAAALANSCREMEMTAEARLDLLPLLQEIEARFSHVSSLMSREYGAIPQGEAFRR